MIDSPHVTRLLGRLQTRKARAGVVGLGYVGLPLAVELSRAGLQTTGFDLDGRKVASIVEGRSYIADVADDDVERLTERGLLTASIDFDAIGELDTINICVPTPLRKTRDPDMSYVIAAVEQVAARLRPGMLVVLESTTYPGTTEEVVQTMLEATGLRAGVDFFLAFSPERIDPGNRLFNTRNVPKVVGGVTPDCCRVACELYRLAIESVVPVSSPRVAEMVKLLENTFRAVNIGLVNELAMMCSRMRIDVWEVIDAARTKPFGFMPFYPGPGLGGHCIPIDPFYLSWKAKQSGFDARFIELAGHVNGAMPHMVVELITEALNTRSKSVRGASILVLGVTYKRDIADIRESPALDVMTVLARKGAQVSYSDPHVSVLPAEVWGGQDALESVAVSPAILQSADCVAILTDHSTFDVATIAACADIIVDTRNVTAGRVERAFRLGAPVSLSAQPAAV
jgi:UDP-N-acetyl-D-glucosamine dehydrogenase